MTDVERFFILLVRNLAGTDPARLHQPLPLPYIRDSIIPYRANRRALQLESSEDYELVLLQLCAGEAGFATTEPEDVRVLFAGELRSTNPDLSILHRHEKAVVTLEASRVAEALDPKPHRSFAPPADRVGTTPGLETEAPPKPAPAEPHPEAAPHCTRCGGLLPAGRAVNFCPHCGRKQAHRRCPACASEVEPSWRHCVTCGAHVSGN